MERLSTHYPMMETQRQLFIDYTVMLDYLHRPDHRGGLMPGQKLYRANGEEHKFEDVSFEFLLKSVENEIERLPEFRRAAVFMAVMDGLPGAKELANWKKYDPYPYADPATEFSLSRAVSLSPKKLYRPNKMIITGHLTLSKGPRSGQVQRPVAGRPSQVGQAQSRSDSLDPRPDRLVGRRSRRTFLHGKHWRLESDWRPARP
jgi:hypothetical protein